MGPLSKVVKVSKARAVPSEGFQLRRNFMFLLLAASNIQHQYIRQLQFGDDT